MSAEKKKSANVVHLNEYVNAPEGKRSPGKPARRSETLLRECVRRATESLANALSGVLDRVDDALFDLAEKADSNNVRTLYFEAMREVRLQRNAIESAFTDNLGNAPKESAQPKRQQKQSPELFAFEESSLDLVDDGDLEESLAVTNMVNKVKAQCKKELFALDQRVGALLRDPKLERAANPLGPEAVCDAFRKACQAIEAPLEVKLIVLKLFDKHMLGELPAVYQEVNRYLLEQGVLPQLRTGIKKAPAGTRAPEGGARAPEGGARAPERDATEGPTEAGSPAPGGAAGDDMSPQQLYNALRQLMSVGGGAGGDGNRPPPEPAVLKALTGLQKQAPAGLEGESDAAPGTVNVLHSLKGTEAAQGMSQLDGQLVDIVAMMFDFIFDDRNLPDSMKALIGRLQIPFVKVAMVDPEFFSRRFHPARRLLNALAEAGIGWQEKHEDAETLFRKAEQIVHRILNDFTDDVQIFNELLAELEQFLQEEEQRAEAMAEEETSIIESREQLRVARSVAQEHIQQRLDAEEIPQALHAFFEHYWKEFLILSYCQAGSEGEDWQWGLSTMDDLIWSVTPKTSAEDRGELLKILPGLIKRLNKGMDMVSVPREERDKLTTDLAGYHAAAVRPAGTDAGGPAPSAEQTEAAEPAGSPAASREEKLRSAIARANAAIGMAAERRPECAGMGTTLVAASFHDNRMSVAHVGDSRLYRLREGAFEQITVDHSLAQQLIERGFYTPDEAKREVRKNVVTRGLDGGTDGTPDVQEQPVRRGDLYLLCSDGLSDLVEDDAIKAALEGRRDDLGAAADHLIQLANEAGGNDNISVLLVDARAAFPAVDDGEADLSEALAIVSRTDVGKKRSHNEDATGRDPRVGALVLADGMGGCNAGEVASAIAVRTVLNDLGARDAVVEPAADTVAEETAEGAIIVPELETEAEGEEVYDEYHDMVAEMSVGAWVEFHRDQERPVRARLAWISPAGAYLFTDRAGAKVVETSQYGLAAELRKKTAEILDDAPLFERALTDLTERLKPQA
ncbi:MAG: DUF1631 family protein [Gammaproteobacteria bacterium]|nr:DUF1631 family protein [Gammaproteobacteria bacterium]NIR85528.1 DUF1631 family protein [Gammaproteobacteria bacterium]NIR89787.1 DUF1631 family protein [Gammaproteobacteria bacterium]NIU06663.1 DUF1631 family protein [Gammaproteobacteria bacterium]NIV75054.1 DUF1631 family protein [Gammaproteobacteria bacterium]